MHNKQERMRRARRMNQVLIRLFPDISGTGLRHRSRWQLVVAVILSAQTTDKKVNEVTPALFSRYKTVRDFAEARPRDITRIIREIGFAPTKARHIVHAARRLRDVFGGRVPRTMSELTTLPGVGRKTANVVLGNAFSIAVGIPVDTHVRRFARRFCLTNHSDPENIEQDLMELLPQSEWFQFSNRLIAYGRAICPARPHECSNHPLTRIYPPAAHHWPKR